MHEESVQQKKCPRCKKSFPRTPEFFHKNKKFGSGLNYQCKPCQRLEAKEWKSRNPEKKAECDKRHAQANKEKIAAYQKEYRAANAAKTRKYLYEYYHTKLRHDPKFRLVQAVRQGMSRMAKGSIGKLRYVPWNGDDLKSHIEKQFLKGMTWENYGSVWHIDHIIPLAEFNFTTREDPAFKAAWALSNLRPLWAKENLKKNRTRTHLL